MTQTEPTSAPSTGANDLEVDIRLATQKDIAELVLPSWLQSYARSLPGKWMRADGRYSIGRDKYWSSQRRKIEQILSTPTVRVLVASCDGVNIGWACEDRPHLTLHYVYVKDTFRKQGVAKRLVGWIANGDPGLVTLTHLPPVWFSNPREGAKVLWPGHVIIDLVSNF